MIFQITEIVDDVSNTVGDASDTVGDASDTVGDAFGNASPFRRFSIAVRMAF
jgi:hypothetical protein